VVLEFKGFISLVEALKISKNFDKSFSKRNLRI